MMTSLKRHYFHRASFGLIRSPTHKKVLQAEHRLFSYYAHLKKKPSSKILARLKLESRNVRRNFRNRRATSWYQRFVPLIEAMRHTLKASARQFMRFCKKLLRKRRKRKPKKAKREFLVKEQTSGGQTRPSSPDSTQNTKVTVDVPEACRKNVVPDATAPLPTVPPIMAPSKAMQSEQTLVRSIQKTTSEMTMPFERRSVRMSPISLESKSPVATTVPASSVKISMLQKKVQSPKSELPKPNMVSQIHAPKGRETQKRQSLAERSFSTDIEPGLSDITPMQHSFHFRPTSERTQIGKVTISFPNSPRVLASSQARKLPVIPLTQSESEVASVAKVRANLQSPLKLKFDNLFGRELKRPVEPPKPVTPVPESKKAAPKAPASAKKPMRKLLKPKQPAGAGLLTNQPDLLKNIKITSLETKKSKE